MSALISAADSMPNLNTCTLAGKVVAVSDPMSRPLGVVFDVGYLKHWPSGETEEIRIRCYLTGDERVERASWLRPGEVVLVHGEVRDQGAIYAYQLKRLSTPGQKAEDGDADLGTF